MTEPSEETIEETPVAAEEVVDVESTEVVEDEKDTPDIFKEEQTISNQQRRHYEKLRATTLNKMLKNYKRRQKNPLNIARKLGKK
jgi:hypothetical protein